MVSPSQHAGDQTPEAAMKDAADQVRSLIAGRTGRHGQPARQLPGQGWMWWHSGILLAKQLP